MRPLLQFPVGDRAEVWHTVTGLITGRDQQITAQTIERAIFERKQLDKTGPFYRVKLAQRRADRAKRDAYRARFRSQQEREHSPQQPEPEEPEAATQSEPSRTTEPELQAVKPKPNGQQTDPDTATVGQRSKCVEAANACIDLLKRIGKSNPYRARAFEIVTDWIESNR